MEKNIISGGVEGVVGSSEATTSAPSSSSKADTIVTVEINNATTSTTVIRGEDQKESQTEKETKLILEPANIV